MKIKEEREPGRRLVLANTCYNRNMNFGVSSVPQRVESVGRKKISFILSSDLDIFPTYLSTIIINNIFLN